MFNFLFFLLKFWQLEGRTHKKWGPNEPAPTKCTIIHWMPVMTQLWMNLNSVHIRFHLGNPMCKKQFLYIGR